MVLRHWIFAWAFCAVIALLSGGAGAQNPPPQAAQPATVPQPAKPASPPQVNTAEIDKRANDSVGADIQAKIKGWQKDLDRIEEGLRKPNVSNTDLNADRDALFNLRADGETFWKTLETPLRTIDDQVQKLPPVPAQDQPPETEQAALLRAKLNYQLGIFKSAQSSLSAMRPRVDQLLNTIQDIRRKNFTTNLFQPVHGVFSEQTWTDVPDYAPLAASRVESVVQDWWNASSDKQELTNIATISLGLFLILSFLAWRGIDRLRSWDDAGDPPFWRRASSAAGVIFLRSLPVVLPVVFLYNAADEVQPMPEKIGRLFYSGGRSLIIIAVVYALMTTVLAPGARRWRLIPASDKAAIRISWLVLTLVLLYGITTTAYSALRIVQAPFSLTLALTLPANLIVAGLVAAVLRTPLGGKDAEGLPSLTWLRTLYWPLWIITAAIVITAFAGYLALSRFIAMQLIVTGSVLALVYLLLLWADGVAQAMSDEHSSLGSWLKKAGLDQDKRERLSVPVSLVLKFVVLIASVPFILLQWNYPWPDIMELYRELFFGFRIGNTQVSLAAILASIVVFVLGYFAAKLFQGWLDVQVLKPAGLSGGLRDSIRTTVGYAGVFAAGLLALSYAGFNLSNLAIVAGAFSVGIGFGLQSVVSNFVSGLILLAERPIKVGDLVTVGGEEGYVRKISVRSTEIETFDRANVLVPNSSFITEKVKNWTLRNNTARVAIAVGVEYGCDPRQVKEILLKVAQDHLNVMTSPEPSVDFEDFGADALHFKLYAYVYDLSKGTSTRTDLRIAILEAFKEAGIIIPSRQTEITLREMDWLREAISQYMAKPLNGHASSNGSKAPASANGK